MLKSLFVYFLTILSLETPIQIDVHEPVQWHIYTEKISIDSFRMNFDAEIREGWMIYSSFSPAGGPLPTSVTLSTDHSDEYLGNLIEPISPLVEYEPLFDQEVWKFKKKAKFYTAIHSLEENAVVRGTITYMACNGRQCLPPTDVPFVTVLK